MANDYLVTLSYWDTNENKDYTVPLILNDSMKGLKKQV